MSGDWMLDIILVEKGLLLIAIADDGAWVERQPIADSSMNALVSGIDAIAARRVYPGGIATDGARHWSGLAFELGVHWRLLKRAETVAVEKIAYIVAAHDGDANFADVEAAKRCARERRLRTIGQIKNDARGVEHVIHDHSRLRPALREQRLPLGRRIMQRIFCRRGCNHEA